MTNLKDSTTHITSLRGLPKGLTVHRMWWQAEAIYQLLTKHRPLGMHQRLLFRLT
jgi:hypothetical protein